MAPFERLQQERDARDAAQKDLLAMLSQLVDDNSFVEKDAFLTGTDLLNGEPIWGEGVLCGTATIDNFAVVVIAQNSQAMYGSFGEATARKMVRALDFALANGLPVVSVLDSAGARVGEGVGVLEGYGAVIQAATKYSLDGGSMHFAVLKGQAVGLMAVYASMCDFAVALPESIMSVPAPQVLAAQVGGNSKQLAGADAVAVQGMVDFVCDNPQEVRDLISDLLYWFAGTFATEDDPNREAEVLAADCSAEALLAALCDDGKYIEYQAKREGAVRCVFAHVNGTNVGIAVNDAQKGNTMSAADADKLCEFAWLLASYNAPFISLVNSNGFADTNAALLQEGMVNLSAALCKVPCKIAVSCGAAIGNAYALLASKGMGYQYTLAFADAIIAPIAPDAAIHLVYADQLRAHGNSPEVQAKLQQLYSRENGDALKAAQAGFVDEVIHPATLRPYVANALLLLGRVI